MGITIAPTLATWALSLSPYAAAAFYLVWGLAFMGATWVTLKAMQRRDSPRWALPFTAGYQLTLWVLNLSLYRSSYARSLWGRDLVLTAALLAAVAILNKNDPNHVTD